MQTSADLVYVDSSALVKLVEEESETRALEQYLAARTQRVSCRLAQVEVRRAARRVGGQAIERADRVLHTLSLLEITDGILLEAGELEPVTLRSLDAIHLAAALGLGRDLGAMVTYDQRMRAAAMQLGITVDQPGR